MSKNSYSLIYGCSVSVLAPRSTRHETLLNGGMMSWEVIDENFSPISSI